MICSVNKMVGVVVLFVALGMLNGCASTVQVEFRFVENQETVTEGTTIVLPWNAYANPLLPIQRQERLVNSNGQVEVRLDLDPDGKPQRINFTGPDGGLHQWCVGDRDRLILWQRDHWIGEENVWVEGHTDDRKYQRVELRVLGD